MLGGMVKKLIIVTGEKESVYAELLSSLISLKDDDTENNQVIGIKDESVEAVVWSEKVYDDNKIQLSSKAKVIFVGKTKATEPFIVSIRFNKNLERFGIKLGWETRQSFILNPISFWAIKSSTMSSMIHILNCQKDMMTA